jgi:hypothetical protein
VCKYMNVLTKCGRREVKGGEGGRGEGFFGSRGYPARMGDADVVLVVHRGRLK